MVRRKAGFLNKGMEPNAGIKSGKGVGEMVGKSIRGGRERGGSLGNIEDFVKRKRESDEGVEKGKKRKTVGFLERAKKQ